MTERWICTACGTQFPERATQPRRCPICEDERQPPNRSDVKWVTLADLADSRQFRPVDLEPGLTALVVDPPFAIGQAPILVTTPQGNVVWDCMAPFDETIEAAVRSRGPLLAIAISHPHFHTTMVEWADRLDVPIYLHADNRPWVMRSSPRISYFEEEALDVAPGATIMRLGGHFPGSCILRWEHASDGKGVLLTGDTITALPGAHMATCLYSYPNRIGLAAQNLEHIRDIVSPLRFDRLYSAWVGTALIGDADEAVRASLDRHLRVLGGTIAAGPDLSLLDKEIP